MTQCFSCPDITGFWEIIASHRPEKAAFSIYSRSKVYRIVQFIQKKSSAYKRAHCIKSFLRQLHANNPACWEIGIHLIIESHKVQHTGSGPEDGPYRNADCDFISPVKPFIPPSCFHKSKSGKTLYFRPVVTLDQCRGNDYTRMPPVADDMDGSYCLGRQGREQPFYRFWCACCLCCRVHV